MINFKMILFYTISKISIISMLTLSINCLPSGPYDNNYSRQKRGIFGPDPKELEKHDLTLSYYNDTTENTDDAIETTDISTEMSKKKWKVGRVSRKQYEIVNMIWRKTKIFLDTETTTVASTTNTNWNSDIKTYFTRRSTNKNPETFRNKPTDSYIEFYYLDEIGGPRNEEKNRSSRLNAEYIRNRPQVSVQNSKKFKPVLTNSPFLAFHLNILPRSKPSVTSATVSNKLIASSYRDHIKRLTVPFLHYDNFKHQQFWDKINQERSTHTSKIRRRSKTSVVLEDYKDQTCPLTTLPNSVSATTTTSLDMSTENILNNVATTFYDRIKFFEIYDRQTEKDLKVFCDNFQHKHNIKNYEIIFRDDQSVEKILLEHVDVGNSHHEGISNNKAKKHVNENEYTRKRKPNTSSNLDIKNSPPSINSSPSSYHSPPPSIINYFEISLNDSKNPSSTRLVESTERKPHLDLSKVVSWSDYPFAAVYVYEPSQILCDAAAISQHWLITAGACLSRQHRMKPSLEGRSAFVTYCGAVWRHPELISYVKYTLVHPKYNPKERSRRFLYNIGLIQVVGSLMSSCPGWAPISLMSHQFTTPPEGYMAMAVGWGLDRYAAKYPDTEIPSHPLSVYIGLVHTNHCPGNIGYNEAKLVEPLHVMKNLYCLSLPPYNKEESDPVHGSLLLIGGKLIALYLQEERRGFGKQSAQYTGIWKLIPWVLEVAREPDDIDAFSLDV